VGLGTKDLKNLLAFVGDAHDLDAPEPLTTELARPAHRALRV
jgi:hypothetical protein